MLDAIFSMNTVWWGLMIIYIPACIGLIGIVLLQQGKGGGFGGALGGGAGPGADTVFGPKAQSLPVKITYVGAALFMVIAIVLSVLSGKVNQGVAPELAVTSGDDPTITIQGGGLSSLGIGTAIVDDGAHDAAQATIEAASEATEESEPAEVVTEEATTDVAE
jgi:preprotein translocase subunit SecG